jgi:hypothetical protein
MTKKHRLDTVHAEGEMVREKMPMPPEHIRLPDEAMPTWNNIVRAREYKSWTAIDLEHAANLASCLCDLERLRHEVRREGDIIENLRGTPIVNPKHTLLETLSRRSVALSRMLHVHAEATVGKSEDHAKRSTKQRSIHDVMDESRDDELLARPH